MNCIFSHAYNKSCEQTLQSAATERLRVCLYWTDPHVNQEKKQDHKTRLQFVIMCLLFTVVGWVGAALAVGSIGD